jgi:hypothetical protein
MRPMLRLWLMLLAAALVHAPALRAQATDEDIEVAVKRDGPRVIVDVRLQVAATPAQVWEVLTDYEGAPRFISKLRESRVLSRSADRLVVSQKGTAGFGPFSVELESVREVRLEPLSRTEARAIGGSAGPSRATTQLVARQGGTEIIYHAESEPPVWVPPLIGPAVIESDTRARFLELRGEILRRRERP